MVMNYQKFMLHCHSNSVLQGMILNIRFKSFVFVGSRIPDPTYRVNEMSRFHTLYVSMLLLLHIWVCIDSMYRTKFNIPIFTA